MPPRRSYDVRDPRVQRMAAEIQASEDQRIFEALAAVSHPPPAQAPLTREDVRRVFEAMNQQPLHATRWHIPPDVAQQVMRYTASQPTPLRGRTMDAAFYDEVAHFREGQDSYDRLAMSMGTTIQSPSRRPGTVPVAELRPDPMFTDLSIVATPLDPRAIFHPPVRTELEVLPADEPRTASIGWAMQETIGVAFANPRGLRNLEMRGNRVAVPEFDIASSPTIHLDDVRARRFDLVDRGIPDPDPNVLAVLAAFLKSRQRVTVPALGPTFKDDLYAV